MAWHAKILSSKIGIFDSVSIALKARDIVQRNVIDKGEISIHGRAIFQYQSTTISGGDIISCRFVTAATFDIPQARRIDKDALRMEFSTWCCWAIVGWTVANLTSAADLLGGTFGQDLTRIVVLILDLETNGIIGAVTIALTVTREGINSHVALRVATDQEKQGHPVDHNLVNHHERQLQANKPKSDNEPTHVREHKIEIDVYNITRHIIIISIERYNVESNRKYI